LKIANTADSNSTQARIKVTFPLYQIVSQRNTSDILAALSDFLYPKHIRMFTVTLAEFLTHTNTKYQTLLVMYFAVLPTSSGQNIEHTPSFTQGTLNVLFYAEWSEISIVLLP